MRFLPYTASVWHLECLKRSVRPFSRGRWDGRKLLVMAGTGSSHPARHRDLQTRASLCDLADLDEQAIDHLELEIDEVLLCPWLIKLGSGDTSHAANEAGDRQISLGQSS